jgi:hypothetical protein
MPPAFNLSQDQTLQLNLMPELLLVLLCITQSKRGLLLCEHLLDALPLAGTTLASSSSRAAPSAQAPTLIGCEFLKSVGCGERI